MDIVDSQSHLGPGGILELLAAMDALGINAVLIDEVWFVGGGEMPTYTLQAGGEAFHRAVTPTAELAALSHPDRISYVVKVDRRDPELPALVRIAHDASHARGLRTSPGLSKSDLAALASGGYDEMFRAADDAGLPVFITLPGNPGALRPVAERFSDVTFILDHCGMPFTEAMRQALVATGYGDDLADMGTGDKQADFEAVLRLGDLPNVALKWGHPQGLFGVSGYPFTGLRPYLRGALDAFGAERVMWAGDASVNLTGESWGELLFCLFDNPDISDSERAAILGGTARKLVNWPA